MLETDVAHLQSQFRQARILDPRTHQVECLHRRQLRERRAFRRQVIQHFEQSGGVLMPDLVKGDRAGCLPGQGRLGQQHLQQLLFFDRQRLRWLGHRASRATLALAALQPRTQFLQSRPYGLLLECQALRNAGDDELLLDGAGRPGHVRSQRDHSQDRVGSPPPSFDPGISPRRHHLVELEFQGVHCPSQYRAKCIRALLHEQVARVKSFRRRGDGQVHILADEYLEGAVHARLAAGVCIKHQHHARHADPPDALHVPLVQGRSHGGDHLVHACLVGCQHVHVAFHHGQKTGLGGSLPRQVQSIEMFALGKNGRV